MIRDLYQMTLENSLQTKLDVLPRVIGTWSLLNLVSKEHNEEIKMKNRFIGAKYYSSALNQSLRFGCSPAILEHYSKPLDETAIPKTSSQNSE